MVHRPVENSEEIKYLPLEALIDALIILPIHLRLAPGWALAVAAAEF